MKIAFCFLTINNIENEDLWKEFFKNAVNYNIYINSKNKTQSYFNKYVLPTYYTKNKTDISIVYATHYLLQEASKDSENKIFIFLCGSCIPLISFSKLYEKLINLNKPIIKEFPQNRKDRYFSLNKDLQKYLHYSTFTKQHPNMILPRDYVNFFIQNINLAEYFKKINCVDEHYFINVLKLYNKQYYNHQIMFCNYDLNKTQALNFNNVKGNLIKQLINNEYYFIRKINNKTVLDKKIIDDIYNDKNIIT